MFRKLRKALLEKGLHKLRRPRRDFAPVVSRAELENRQLMSVQGLGKLLTDAAVPLAIHASQTAADGLDSSPAGLAVIKQYRSVLLRDPSPEEQGLRISQLRSGLGVIALRNSLLRSPERQDLLNSLNINLRDNPRDFVDSLYLN